MYRVRIARLNVSLTSRSQEASTVRSELAIALTSAGPLDKMD